VESDGCGTFKNSIYPKNARKDFRVRQRPKILPDAGHDEDGCGTVKTASVRRMPGRISGCGSDRKFFQMLGMMRMDAEL